MVSSKENKNRPLCYIIVTLLLSLTSFEYFFREGMLTSLFMIVCIGYLFIFRIKIKVNVWSRILFTILLVFPMFHYFKDYDFNVRLLLSSVISLLGVFSIAIICCRDFVHCYERIIYIIACYSLLIWAASFIPEIKDFMFYKIAPNFKSLNNEIAIVDGGGVNILIYNFQSNYINELVGISRNCGPFWEPGMYAVFLVVGLFLYNFLGADKIKWFNTICILNLISTISTGGILCGFLLCLLYLAKPDVSPKAKLLLLPLFVLAIIYGLSLEYIGQKTLEQLENSNIGSDSSRFGAIKTQFEMILNSPILGGEKIETYTRGRTLASGILLPIVNMGLLGGLMFYVLMVKAYISLFGNYTNRPVLYGTYFFAIVICLSISQTILMSPFFISLMFVGLLQYHKYSQKLCAI